MKNKNIIVAILAIFGIYFLLFHTSPFPFNHDIIGLPPFHILHAFFGVVLLLIAGYFWKKK